jgi:biopolymer transport protein TolQ
MLSHIIPSVGIIEKYKMDNYSVALNTRSFVSIIAEADIVVQLVSLILLIASVWSGAIIINKILALRRIRKGQKKFAKVLDSNLSLEDISHSMSNSSSNSVEQFFYKLLAGIGSHKPSIDFNNTAVSLKENFIARLESDLNYLATISSAAPFIGLFGTVWGIMSSFQAIAFSKNTSLAVVAPGIAEALFATALGLVAAIPALIFYNILLSKVTVVDIKMDSLLIKLHARLQQAFKFKNEEDKEP